MATFREANQVRVVLKMKLCNYAWYRASIVSGVSDGWGIIVTVKHIDNKIRKLIPPVIDSVSIKTEVE